MSINYQDLLELIGSQVVMIHSLQRELQRLQMQIQQMVETQERQKSESAQQDQQNAPPEEDRDE